MIGPLGQPAAAPAPQPEENRKILHWRRNERMGGMVPVWENRAPAQARVEERLSHATGGGTENFAGAMAYAQTGDAGNPYQNAKEFGFADLLDMVNPLQHIPVVGYLYRELTGDDIRPIARVIGGGVYGGALGAAAGLADTVVEYETGRSMTGNVVAMITNGETPHYRSDENNPQRRLDAAATGKDAAIPGLPGSVIGFADLGGGRGTASSSAKTTRYSYND